MKKMMVPLSFALSAALFLVAGLTPVIQGHALEATYTSVGALSLVLAIATWSKARKEPGPPSS